MGAMFSSLFVVIFLFETVPTCVRIYLQTHDATRSLVKNSDRQAPAAQSVSSSGGGALVSSLRQQVHSLDVALRGKEGEMAGLKSGVAASRLREMEIQTDTYYREICRYVFMCTTRNMLD